MRRWHVSLSSLWLVLIALFTAANPLLARETCRFAFDFREEYDSDSLIPKETLTPVFHTDSFAARFPGIANEIEQIELRLPQINKLFASDPNLTPRMMFERIVRYRMEEADRLIKLTRQTRDPVLVKALERAAKVMKVSERSIAKVNETLNRPIKLRNGGVKAYGEFYLKKPLSGRDFLFFQSYLSPVMGISGELKALIRLPGVIGFGEQVRDFYPDAKAKLLAAGIHVTEVERLLDKEIDVIFSYGSSWAEVKNRRLDRSALDTRIGGMTVREKINKQALDNVKLLKLLELVEHIELHQIFVHGIDEGAAEFLREFDIIVEGLDPAA